MCILKHSWSRWSNAIHDSIDKVEKDVHRYRLVQMRTCKKCNKQELNTL